MGFVKITASIIVFVNELKAGRQVRYGNKKDLLELESYIKKWEPELRVKKIKDGRKIIIKAIQ